MIRMFFLMDGVGVGGSCISAATRYRNSNVQAKYPQMVFVDAVIDSEGSFKRSLLYQKHAHG